MADRPLSPHLSIWKWGPHMTVSILHRVSGDGMAIVGLGVLGWWLGALASGPDAYATFSDHASSWYGIAVLIGLTWAFFNHASSGIRHFVLDTGAGYDLDTNRTYSWVSIASGVLLTAIVWLYIIVERGI
ncbi:succinate dehydrogenase, cytochrome b556 subunit [Erythrobacter arachoides]|uniref:Succinate dehydrogenase cytochrome b556 subunit n=2 Tax=Aurantiacibacter arachoides TaxID=1850444 RepID=A0A845A3A8_9SPHN|nr:succinate dehydrogenase, cytochrome b556 subunit [Aurantiacibacter arachoides]MXO93417.1 succinate dehydrogenase, cytochrome b556 subunit [Aurantiacibacter arachoides]GGD49551.1 succinate dehydrogenase, cytochrome b556 subunit [Aurantiacibacter arachoides]